MQQPLTRSQAYVGLIFGHAYVFSFVFVQQREVFFVCFVREKIFCGAQQHLGDFRDIFFWTVFTFGVGAAVHPKWLQCPFCPVAA